MALVAGSRAPTSAEQSADAAAGSDANSQYVSRADFDAALSKQASDLKAGIGREIKELKEMLAGVKPKVEEAADTGRKSADVVTRAAEEKLAALEAREEKQRQKALRMSLRDALRDAGADPHLAELAVPAVLERDRSRFKMEETEYGDFRIVYGDEGADAAAWAKAYLESEEGKRIRARRSSPSMPNASGQKSSAGQRTIPASMAKHLTDEEMASGKYAIVPG